MRWKAQWKAKEMFRASTCMVSFDGPIMRFKHNLLSEIGTEHVLYCFLITALFDISVSINIWVILQCVYTVYVWELMVCVLLFLGHQSGDLTAPAREPLPL